MPLRPSLVLCAAALVAACGSFPQLDAVVSDEAWASDYPALVPAETLRARATARPVSADGTTLSATSPAPEIDARAASLKARAARLRGEVIGEADRDRLNQTIEMDEDEG
ncbi:hypothetical protein [Roseovarius sp.]|uniref:hypothetical protein n=1 Tax=Roseovarius sp. TaxID=1486281 RepID=UPI003BA92362